MFSFKAWKKWNLGWFSALLQAYIQLYIVKPWMILNLSNWNENEDKAQDQINLCWHFVLRFGRNAGCVFQSWCHFQNHEFQYAFSKNAGQSVNTRMKFFCTVSGNMLLSDFLKFTLRLSWRKEIRRKGKIHLKTQGKNSNMLLSDFLKFTLSLSWWKEIRRKGKINLKTQGKNSLEDSISTWLYDRRI